MLHDQKFDKKQLEDFYLRMVGFVIVLEMELPPPLSEMEFAGLVRSFMTDLGLETPMKVGRK